MAQVTIQEEDFDAAAEIEAATRGRADIGAVVTFSGRCRDDDGLAALDIEHYPGMADAEIVRVAAEAEARWPLQACRVIHRYGAIRPGQNIVFVLTASAHRSDAFAAADFLMDFLKTRAPFWKRNHHVDGSAGEWVAPKSKDEAATRRWASNPS